jgi:NAD(P)-dependent dehydrogenase (short-subunit alcohol dehydrogenase family)
VANAGVAPAAPFLKTGADIFRQSVAVNLFGVVEAARAVLGGMVERRSGRIIAIASTAGLKGYPYVSSYCASKHAVIGFVRALALETAKSGVTVNAVCPGFTETDIVAESIERIVSKTGRTPEAALAELVKHNPQQRLIQPDEVAETVLWLCSDGARSITGQAVSVSGGEI